MYGNPCCGCGAGYGGGFGYGWIWIIIIIVFFILFWNNGSFGCNNNNHN